MEMNENQSIEIEKLQQELKVSELNLEIQSDLVRRFSKEIDDLRVGATKGNA
jgi:hypothetical protein